MPAEDALCDEQGCPRGEQPAVLAVGAPQAQLQLERTPIRGRGRDLVLPPPTIGRMNALGPAGAPLLLKRPAPELQPAPVEIGELALRVGHPHETGGGVRHQAEQPLAVLQLPLGALPGGDVLVENDDAPRPPPIRALRAEPEPALAPVGGGAGVLHLEALLPRLEDPSQAGHDAPCLLGAFGHFGTAQLQEGRAHAVRAADEGMRLVEAIPGLVDGEDGASIVQDRDVDGERIERGPQQLLRPPQLVPDPIAHPSFVCNRHSLGS